MSVDITKLTDQEIDELQKKLKKFRVEETDTEIVDSNGEIPNQGTRQSNSNGERAKAEHYVVTSLRLPRWYWELRR